MAAKKHRQKPTFKKKWQACLYETFRISKRWLEWWNKRESWQWQIDREYLREHGVKTYSSWEHHVRRLATQHLLYCRQGTGISPHEYLISKAGINTLQHLGVINEKKATVYKRRLEVERG